MSIAHVVASRTTWPGKSKVGCVVTQDKQVVSTGYAGLPAGWKNEFPREDKKFWSHAEENAIAQAAKHGAKLKGATAYCTLSPCVPCARMLINAGISSIVYCELWDEAEGLAALQLLSDCGVLLSCVVAGAKNGKL